MYSNDKGVFPTSLRVFRESGYTKVSDKDPWGNDYVLSPVLSEGRKSTETGETYIYSKGPGGTGSYIRGRPQDTRRNEAVGYSSICGSFSGR